MITFWWRQRFVETLGKRRNSSWWKNVSLEERPVWGWKNDMKSYKTRGVGREWVIFKEAVLTGEGKQQGLVVSDEIRYMGITCREEYKQEMGCEGICNLKGRRWIMLKRRNASRWSIMGRDGLGIFRDYWLYYMTEWQSGIPRCGKKWMVDLWQVFGEKKRWKPYKTVW